MTRRERRKRIIHGLSQGIGFYVLIGNRSHHAPFGDQDPLDMLTDDALDEVARDLVKQDRRFRRTNAANREFYVRQRAAAC